MELTEARMMELRDLSTPALTAAAATGAGNARMGIPFWKHVQICLLSPIAALLRFLI